VVVGDYRSNMWRYKAHNNNLWINIPSENITFNGTDTLFNLININVSQAINSNELRKAPFNVTVSQISNRWYLSNDYVNLTLGKSVLGVL